jgi:cytochrome P450
VTDRCPYQYPFAFPSATDMPKEMHDLHGEPVVPVTLPSGDTALLITRYDDIRAVLGDPRVSKNRNRPDVARMTVEKKKAFQSQVSMDPPDHTRMRRLIAKAFTATRVERLRPRVRELADGLIDAMVAGSAPADLAEGFAFPLTIQVICEILGVPIEDRDLFHDKNTPPWQYVRDLIEHKREAPDDNVISALVQVRDEDDGRLSDTELQFWSTVLLLAGYETTANQLGGCAVVLLEHKEQLAYLRADLDGRMPKAVEELLRCQVVGSSLSMLRYVTEDIEVGGVHIPAGSSIIPALESANFDPSAFDRPAEFDLAREGRHAQLTFSSGQHFCVGAPLARLELQVGLTALLCRLPELRLTAPADRLARRDDVFFPGFAEIPVAW